MGGEGDVDNDECVTMKTLTNSGRCGCNEVVIVLAQVTYDTNFSWTRAIVL